MSRPSTIGNLYPPSTAHTAYLGSQSSSSLNTKTLTLWIHDPDGSPTLSRNEAVLNYELFPPGVAKPGDVAEVRLLPQPSATPNGNASSEGYSSSGGGHISDSGCTGPSHERRGGPDRKGSRTTSNVAVEEGASPKNREPKEEGGSFLFVIKELEESQKKPNIQISLANHVAALFGFPSRATVRVTIVDKPLHEASHVEIYFRDQYITRSDLWRLTTTLLADTCPYKSQKMLFVNSIRATVGNVWVRGEKVKSAYFSWRTVPIFRSESANYVLFIQMSQEMWHFDTDDSGDGECDNTGDPLASGNCGVGGEILFNKLINSFLPELFKRWRRINAHHLVSIVLFTRIVYEHGEPVGVIGEISKENEEFLGTPGGIGIGEGRRYRDFFRVVVSSMGSVDWTTILDRLKREFALFLKDVLVQPVPNDDTEYGMTDITTPASAAASIMSRPGTPGVRPVDQLRLQTSSTPTSGQSPRLPPADQPRKTIITGRPSVAIHGNILEAINLATIQFSQNYIDRDLVRTGVSIILVTPGTGHFEVDYETLKATTEGLIAHGMGIDLVCLSKVPLHTVPLFRYRNPAKKREEDGNTRPGLSPPKQTAVQAAKSDPGEWIYAMPHWIDISFWSAAAEKKTRRYRGPGSNVKKRDRKLQKKKSSQGFQARCKMYEIQMMGIVEDETSCIAVPFLHKNPLWKPFPEEGPNANPREINTKEAEKKRKEQWKEEHFKWMDEYDSLAFRPLPVLQEGLRKAEEKRNGTEAAEKKIWKTLDEEDPLLLGTSFCSESTRGQGSARAGGSGFFDRKMKERRPSLDSPVEPKPSSVTGDGGVASGGMSFLKPGAVAKRFGFGLKNWGGATKSAPKAAAITNVTGLGTMTSGLGPGGVMVTRGFDTGEHISTSPKCSLSPKGTVREPRPRDPRGDSSPEKAMTWGSRPIPTAGTNSAASALGAATRDKERRRSLVGSPLEPRGLSNIDILKAASSLSRPPGPRIDLVANADKTAAIPPTVSPTSALAPWVQVLNPSNPKQNTTSMANQYRRWHHVFPKPVKISTVKWKSLCTPASLPLTTEHFPTAEQLATEYQESPYVISQNSDYDLMENPGNRGELVRAMIAHRLTQGFQIVVGSKVAEATQGRGGHAGIYDKNYMGKPGSFCFMSRGSQIHQLICDEEYNVEVKRYIRKPTEAITPTKTRDSDLYTSYIKTVLKTNYRPVRAGFQQPISDYNWNYADQYIGGYEDSLSDQLKYWRARFVLIPGDPPESARRGQPHGAELNDEEIRLEGIRRLTMLFQRNRWVPPEERHYEKYAGRQKVKENNPLQIIYKTVDPSLAVAQEIESLFIPDTDGHMRRSQLLTTEMFEARNLDIKAIAQELQGPRGVRLQDRRWHLKLHNNCFTGEEMVTWIVENFKGVATRQEAEAVGKELFREGLFQHVDKRHEFRDGNYFYRIAESYTRPSSRGGWFGTFKTDRSVPSTPLADIAFPLHRTRSRSNTVYTDEYIGEGVKTPTAAGPPSGSKKKVEVELSKSMKYDVDPAGRSYRSEVITLHYDRVHNPDNCYHIRIDWMNTTPKLIEDCLTSWARTMDRYGLKLVEAPIEEISKVSMTNLFRSPIVVKLALKAPSPLSSPQSFPATTAAENIDLIPPLSATPTTPGPTPVTPTTTASSSLPSPSPPDSFAYHKALLKKFNFVLDTEATTNFPEHVKVRYSYGDLTYAWSQYIHRSGVLFAQISDDGDFHLIANRAYTLRVTAPPAHQQQQHQLQQQQQQQAAAGGASPVYPSSAVTLGGGSPLAGAVDAAAATGGGVESPEQIKERFEAFCSDTEGLRRFYEEVYRGKERSGSGGVGVGGGGGSGSGSGASAGGAGTLVGGKWDSPVIAPVGVVRMGSPTVGASDVHAGGRTVSVSGRSVVSEEEGIGGFLLAR